MVIVFLGVGVGHVSCLRALSAFPYGYLSAFLPTLEEKSKSRDAHRPDFITRFPRPAFCRADAWRLTRWCRVANVVIGSPPAAGQ